MFLRCVRAALPGVTASVASESTSQRVKELCEVDGVPFVVLAYADGAPPFDVAGPRGRPTRS
jgi:hypothetical protein